MNTTERHRALYRLLASTIEYRGYSIVTPSLQLLVAADEVYNAVLRRFSFEESWLSKEDARQLVLSLKIYEGNFEHSIKELNKREEDVKVDLYSNATDPKQVSRNRSILKMVREKLSDTIHKKYLYDSVTARGYASEIKAQYLLSNTVYKDGRKVWDSYEKADYAVLNEIMGYVYRMSPSLEDIREIARTDPWRSYWTADKTNPIGKPVIEWTDNQRALVAYSRLYDSIYESGECPADEIIEDNDMLDGWMIKMRRERDSEKNKKNIENTLGKNLQNSKELFIVANTQEHADKINAMNDEVAQRIKQQRAAVVQQQGEAKDIQFSDVQVELLNKGQHNARV